MPRQLHKTRKTKQLRRRYGGENEKQNQQDKLADEIVALHRKHEDKDEEKFRKKMKVYLKHMSKDDKVQQTMLRELNSKNKEGQSVDEMITVIWKDKKTKFDEFMTWCMPRSAHVLSRKQTKNKEDFLPFKDTYEKDICKIVRKHFHNQKVDLHIDVSESSSESLCIEITTPHTELQEEAYDEAELKSQIAYAGYSVEDNISDNSIFKNYNTIQVKYDEYEVCLKKQLAAFEKIDKIVLCVGHPVVEVSVHHKRIVELLPPYPLLEISHIQATGIFRGKGLGRAFHKYIASKKCPLRKVMCYRRIIYKDSFASKSNPKLVHKKTKQHVKTFDYLYAEGTSKWLRKQGFNREFEVKWSSLQKIHDVIRKIGEEMPINIPYLFGWHAQATWNGQYLSSGNICTTTTRRKSKKLNKK